MCLCVSARLSTPLCFPFAWLSAIPSSGFFSHTHATIEAVKPLSLWPKPRETPAVNSTPSITPKTKSLKWQSQGENGASEYHMTHQNNYLRYCCRRDRWNQRNWYRCIYMQLTSLCKVLIQALCIRKMYNWWKNGEQNWVDALSCPENEEASYHSKRANELATLPTSRRIIV